MTEQSKTKEMVRVMAREVGIKNFLCHNKEFGLFCPEKWIKVSENFTSLINRLEVRKLIIR